MSSLLEALKARKLRTTTQTQEEFRRRNPVVVAQPKKIVARMDAPLTSIYKSGGAAWPMERIEPAYRSLIQRSQAMRPCTNVMLQRLVTALSYTAKEGMLHDSLASKLTVAGFLQLSDAKQLALVNSVWNECTRKEAYSKEPSAMVETEEAVAPATKQLPSSVHPNSGSGLPFVKGPSEKPFRTLGIGFRVDGSEDGSGSISSIARITASGMTAQALNKSFMKSVRHMEVTETTVAVDTDAPRIFVRAKDLFNESSVCVSRSLFGATAFPERKTKGRVCLWAVTCNGLKGFDTEKHQIDLKAPWRPGEKCFQKIPAKNVLAYVVIERLGGDDGGKGGWNFRVPRRATWKWVGDPTPSESAYLTAELAAWATGEEHHVSGDYDFA